ncbi:MAG TPA: LLM class flavin-dependent oxidoreductase, partial [Chloroflexota bacterium]|nr:LLM class flavin-dependent oxidoreductase [Chloroflexota bacterium]
YRTFALERNPTMGWMPAEMGVMLHTGDLSFDEIARFANEAAGEQYERFWLTEESGKEAFSLLAMLAREAPGIALGTSILSFYSRTPTLLAMGARTMWELTNGRFALGIGTGGIGFTVKGHGLPIARPIARGRESARIIRGLLTEKRFSYDGEWFRVADFHLREGPIGGQMPLYLAALGPQMVRLAAREFDGFIMNWPTAEAVAEYKDIARQSAEQAGRDPDQVRILSLTMTVSDPNDETSREAMRRGLAFYCASEHYLHIADISGFGGEARRVHEVWQGGDFKKAASLVSDGMVEKFSVTSAKEVRRILDDGVYPIIYPVPRRDRMYQDHVDTARVAMRYVGE